MEGPATNISELTLVCLELAAQLEELSTSEERVACVTEHIAKYTQEKVHMVDFQPGLEWFNVREPLSVAGELRGRIAVLDFFTYCCINCMHILPDLEALEQQHPPSAGEVLVVGVHSAKFENEKVSDNIMAAIERYNIHHPVVNDPQAKLWMELNIACWPTLVILGPSGQPLFVLVGEGHRERLHFYVSTAVQYFSDSGCLKKSPIPLAPSEHCEASNLTLRFPGKVAVYPEGIIVSDSGHNRILLTDYTGTVKQVVGCGESGLRDGSLSTARFTSPQGATYLHPNTILVADTGNHAIRKVDIAAKTVTTIAGTGHKGTDRKGGNIGVTQAISSPWDVCLTRSLDRGEEESENLLLVAMAGSHQLWGVFLTAGKWHKGSSYSEGTVVRLAGSGAEENRNSSYPARAGFAQPSGITCSTHSGTPELFIADSESSAIRKYNLRDGNVKAVVGGARDPLDLFAYGDVDGRGLEAKLQHPMAVTSIGPVVYVADSYNSKIKVIHPSEKTYTISTVSASDSTDNAISNTKDRKLNEPAGLCAGPGGSCLYIADTNNHSIKILSLTDHSLEEFPVMFVDEGDSSSQDLLNANVETENMEGEGEVVVFVPCQEEIEVTLRIKLIFPEGATLNQEAPNRWKIEPSDPEVVVVASQGQLEQDCEVRVRVRASPTTPEPSLTLSCTVFPCLAEGVCSTTTSKHKIKFTPAESQEDTIKDIPIHVKLKL